MDQILDRRNEDGPQKQAEEGRRKARKLKLKTATRAADDGPSAPVDFAAAVAGIFALPLSDAEKAEAVRRLLALKMERLIDNDRL